MVFRYPEIAQKPTFTSNFQANTDFTIENFIQEQSSEKQYTPPIRILFSGDDPAFNTFVTEYVETVY